jgi:acetolactate decarboxylase
MKKMFVYCCLILLSSNIVYAQSVNVLNQYGIAPAFLGGLFREGLSVSQLRLQGSFGIAAPSMVDGELIEFDGKFYQTKSNGETKIAPDSLKVPFGMLCFFQPDTVFTIKKNTSQQEIARLITACLKNNNGIYAIKITGLFSNIKTRAFHKVGNEPFPPIAEIQADQKIFDFEYINGTMFGYRIPALMSGVSGTGFHFHFLSNDTRKGGHVLSYLPQNIQVEIAHIRKVLIEIPDDPSFSAYQTTASK